MEYLISNLKHLRQKHLYTQADIAVKTGCDSQSTVSKWETGEADLPIGKLYILSILYGAKIDDMLNKDLRKEM